MFLHLRYMTILLRNFTQIYFLHVGSTCRKCPLQALQLPRYQLINRVDLVVSVMPEDISEPRLWIDTVEFCGFPQGVDDGGGLTGSL